MKNLLLALCLLLATNAQASIIASKPLDFETPWFGWYSDIERVEVSNGFSISDPAVGNSLTWWGAELTTGSILGQFVFDIHFYDDANGMPAQLPFYSHTTDLLFGNYIGTDSYNPPGSSPAAFADNFLYEASIPDVVFGSAGDYWLSVSAHASAQFIWSHSSPISSELHFRNIRDGETFWTPYDFGLRNDNAFLLAGIGGTVPLPATWLLLLPAILYVLSRNQHRPGARQ